MLDDRAGLGGETADALAELPLLLCGEGQIGARDGEHIEHVGIEGPALRPCLPCHLQDLVAGKAKRPGLEASRGVVISRPGRHGQKDFLHHITGQISVGQDRPHIAPNPIHVLDEEPLDLIASLLVAVAGLLIAIRRHGIPHGKSL